MEIDLNRSPRATARPGADLFGTSCLAGCLALIGWWWGASALAASTQEEAASTREEEVEVAPPVSAPVAPREDAATLEARYLDDPTATNGRALTSALLFEGRTADALAIATGLLGDGAGAEDHLLVARASLAEADRRVAEGETSSFIDSLFADAEHQSRLATADPAIADNAAAFLAFVLFRDDRLDASKAELDVLLARTPDHAEGLALRGYLRLMMGNPEEALTDLEQAIHVAPDRADIRVHYARALAASSPEEAARALDLVIERGLADNAFGKDVYEVLAARDDLAVQTLTRLTRARPEDPNSWYWLGRAQSDAALNAAADDSYTRALEFAPGDPVVLAYRADARGKIEDLAGMVEDLVSVAATDIDLPERDWAIRRLQATTYFYADRGSWSEVARLSRALLSAVPDDPTSHGNLAIALMRLGKIEEAEQIFSDAIEGFPSDHRLQNDLGILLEGVGRVKDAMARFQQAGALGSLDGKENLAVMLFDQYDREGDEGPSSGLEQAEALLREVLAAAPDRVRSLAALERVMEQRRAGSR